VEQVEPKVDRIESQDELYRRVAAEYGAALARMARACEADPDLRRDVISDNRIDGQYKSARLRNGKSDSSLT